MKIELIKETKFNGDVYYFINMDGEYVSNSMTVSKETAEELFEKLKITSVEPKLQVLKVYETNESGDDSGADTN